MQPAHSVFLVGFYAVGRDLCHAAGNKKGGADMTYIEHVFICMASPLLIAALCMGRRQAKFFLCCLAGMGACLLSAYIKTFFAALYAADTIAATA